jgi:hypothetical protein
MDHILKTAAFMLWAKLQDCTQKDSLSRVRVEQIPKNLMIILSRRI